MPFLEAINRQQKVLGPLKYKALGLGGGGWIRTTVRITVGFEAMEHQIAI